MQSIKNNVEHCKLGRIFQEMKTIENYAEFANFEKYCKLQIKVNYTDTIHSVVSFEEYCYLCTLLETMQIF